MKCRPATWLPASGAALMLAAGLTWTAAPAQAMQTVVVSCASASSPSITADPGERIRVVINGNCTQFSITRLSYQSIIVDVGPGQETTPRDTSAGLDNFYRNSAQVTEANVILTSSAFGTITMAVSVYPSAAVSTITVTSSSSGGGGSSAGWEDPSAPAPVVQQFGKPSSITCDAAAPEGLDWSGVASGGWGESWAQWMNGGIGGAVCTRTLVYSSSLGAWTVG